MPFIVSAFGIILSVLLTLALGSLNDIKRGLANVITQVNKHDTKLGILETEVKNVGERITHHEEVHA